MDIQRLKNFFERFPLLASTLEKLNGAHIPFAIGGSGCLYLLGNERLPDDVDIYVPNDWHDEADALFGMKSYPYRSSMEEVRNSNPENNHSIQLTSGLVLHIDHKNYDLQLTPDVLNAGISVEYGGQKIMLLPPEDVVLIKALLQRGSDVGKHDIEDIRVFLSLYPHFRKEYLEKRIHDLGAEERVGTIFK